ncbi:MAG: exodeoxyribonuclease V subunit beta [Pseudomonadota bacterium]|nr:exodeoxyribonuclease V subunit beta [Pseudomonadota bacterium]
MNAATPALDPRQVPLGGIQLIEASAGTGKTFNIAALYVRALLERDLAVGQILVVTFTKAAAGELRERIRRRLADALAVCEGGQASDAPLVLLLADACARTGNDEPALAARLRLALQEFDQAAIHTIHGFCQRALAEAPFVAGVGLDAELLADDSELAAAVMCDVWRRRVAAQPLDPQLAELLLDEAEGPLELATLLRRHQARPLAGVRWPAGSDGGDTAFEAARQHVLAAWQQALSLWAGQRADILAQLAACLPGLDRRSYSSVNVEAAIAQWDALSGAGLPFSPLGAMPRLGLLRADKAQPTKDGLRRGFAAPGHAFFAAAARYLDARHVFAGALGHARAALLRELLQAALPELAARKRQARVQTFDDLLHALYAALHGERGAALAGSLRQRYPLAMVDEFQDTDPIQLAILRRLYEAPDCALFLVGDPKQAIYGFRNADLYCYLQARADAAAVWTLRHNQRASAPLIGALNALFARSARPFLLPSLPYPQVLEGERPRHALQGDPQPTAALQLWLLPPAADGGPCRRADARTAALAATCDEIVRLLVAAGTGLRLGARALRAGDIAVLVRSHADGQAMRLALAARGVASVELSQSSVFESLEAEDLLRLLWAVLEPADSGRVLAALATALVGADGRTVDEVGQDENLLAGWMQLFDDALARWKARGFASMLWPLLERLQVSTRLLAGADGPRRLTNLRHLAELLHAASAEHLSAEALLHWLRARIETPDADETRQLRLDTDAGLVQIVTVHRSKGLEYPVVFCPVLWTPSRPDGRDAFGVREYHLEGAGWIDYRDDADIEDGERSAIREAQAADRLAEDLRLLYVALTRAACRCYLVAGAWRNARGGAATCTTAARTALAWLAEPGAMAVADWQERKVEAGALEAGWHALAAAVADPGAMAVSALPADQGLRWHAPATDPATLQAAPPPAIPPRRRIGSYTALVAARQTLRHDSVSDEALTGETSRDHDLMIPDAAAAPAAGEPLAPPSGDILAFPRGADAGTCLHAILERVDFSSAAQWPRAVDAALAAHAPWLAGEALAATPARLRSMLLGWLGDLARTELAPGLRLDALAGRRTLRELEFHLPVAGLRPEALRAVLLRHGLPAAELRFEVLRGYLKGFIDMVVEHQGRWYVIDWKSNHLGARPQDYAAAGLQAEMTRHDYALQALIYLLALHRLLACRLPDYQPARHLGGALYLFVRGVRPGWRDADGTPCGVWFLPAAQAPLEDLAAAFAAEQTGVDA